MTETAQPSIAKVLERYLKPYEGEASDMMFYITTDGYDLHGQVFYQYRDCDGCWRCGNIDDMGFMPESAGGKTKFDLRNLKPYFTTKDLSTALPFVKAHHDKWIDYRLRDFGLNQQPVVSAWEFHLYDLAKMGRGIISAQSRNRRDGTVQYAVTRLEPSEGVFRTHYYYEGEVRLIPELERIPQEEWEDVVRDALERYWSARFDHVVRLWESSQRVGTRAKTHSQTPSREERR